MAWLIKSVATECKVPDVVAHRVVRAFIAKVKEAAWGMGGLAIPGFLTLSVRRHVERTVVRPDYEGIDVVPERDVMKAKPWPEWRVREVKP